MKKKDEFDLAQMKLVDVRTVERDELADIAKVQVNKNFLVWFVNKITSKARAII